MKRFLFVLLITLLVVAPPKKLIPQSNSGSRTLRYGNRTEIGISVGVGKFKTNVINGAQLHSKNDEIALSFQTINGVWYMNRLFIGVGVGVELWQHGLFYPVFGNITFDIQPKENTFFGSVSLGSSIGNRYGTTFYNSGKGGFMASLGVGYKVKIAKKLKFTYEVFYKYQLIKSTYTTRFDTITGNPVNYIDYNVPESFIGFRIGICY